VVSTKSPLPVLGNVLLQTDGGQLKLAATNLELTVIGWVGALTELLWVSFGRIRWRENTPRSWAGPVRGPGEAFQASATLG
jgi:hypothetical protein